MQRVARAVYQGARPSIRQLHSSPPLRSSYRRFDQFNRGFPRADRAKAKFNAFRRDRVAWVLGGAGLVYVVMHIEKEPHTGRWRFIDVSESYAEQLAIQGINEINSQYKGRILPDNHPTARFVRSVARRIVKANGLDEGGVKWDCHVVADDQTRNAFVLPGGHIYVFTGILQVTQDAEGLAVVLGHEMAHQVARHGAERMSFAKIAQVASLMLVSILDVDLGLSRLLTNLLLTLPNSRTAESEADDIGLRLSAKACFDPRAAPPLWNRMGEGGGSSDRKGSINLDWLSTHPSDSRRSEKLAILAQQLLNERPASCGPLERKYEDFERTSTSFFN